MNLIPLILDYRPAYASEAGGSLLGLPLGTGSVLDRLIDGLPSPHRGEVLIVPPAEGPDDCSECVSYPRSANLKVIPRERFAAAFDGYETSDYLFVFDARRWPVCLPTPAEIGRTFHHYRGATHGIAVGADLERATERIDYDEHGRIRRVQRFYDAKNWPEVAAAAIAYSIVPARALSGLYFESLGDLRCQLAMRGVLSRDVPVSCDMLDLASERAFLNLCERALCEAVPRAAETDYTALRPGVLVGPRCSVHASARLVPPILIRTDTRVEAGATIVGPTLIAAGCRIGSGAIIAQAVVRERTLVPSNTTIRQRVTSASTLGQANGEGRPLIISPSAEAAADWLRVPRIAAALARPLDPRPHRGRLIPLAIKRALDVVLTAVGLVLLSPVFAVAAVAIKLDSKGPVFFRHGREGKEGKEFPCIKFRTMVADAHSRQLELYKDSEVDGPQFKLQRDPRITRVGRWLRGTNIDELPQLINVLLGHMSLVGPRPSPFRENQICVQWRRARLSVRPGITGLWQICRDRDRSRGGFHEWIYYDITYVRHLSVWLDVKIILATLLSLGGRGHVPLCWLVRANRPAYGGEPGRHGNVRPAAAGKNGKRSKAVTVS